MKKSAFILIVFLIMEFASMTSAYSAGAMQIFVRFTKSTGTRTITLDVESWYTIGFLKHLIQGKDGYDPNLQRLIYAGKELQDDLTLTHYNLQKEVILILIIRPSVPQLSEISVTGGDAVSAAGSFSYTVGQVASGIEKNDSFAMQNGVQQTDTRSFCLGANVSFLDAPGSAVQWFATASGGRPLATTTALKTGTYFYTQTTNNVVSIRTPVAVVVNPAAKAGTISLSSASVCVNGDITFSSSAFTGDAIQWEYTADAPLSSTNTTRPFWSAVEGETAFVYTKTNVTNAPGSKFYIRAKIISGSCSTAYSAVKTILVNPTSIAGTAAGGGLICSGGGGTVKLSGNTGKIQWLSSTNGTDYSAVDAAKAASLTVIGLTQNTWYKAQVTSGMCASAFSNPIQFEIGTNATVGIVSAETTSICKGSGTTLNLGTGNTGSILWEKSTNAGTSWTTVAGKSNTLNTGILNATTWFRATTFIGKSATDNCTIARSVPVVINVIAAPLSKGITANTIIETNNGTTLTKALACNDDRKTLTATSGSIGAIQWQWSTTSTTEGFNDIAFANASSFTIIASARARGANYYRAKFTNSCGAFVFSPVTTVFYKDCAPSVAKMKSAAIATIPFDVMAYPNPSASQFTIEVLSSGKERSSAILVYDTAGRLIEQRELESNTIQIGADYPAGVYHVIVTQDANSKTLKLIKH